MTKLKGKVALVTGGGSGIGRGICHRFARDHADVVVNDINQRSMEEVSKAIESMGSKSLSICADVSMKSSVEEMVSRVIKEWGKIDILVNCAGISCISSLIETTEEEFDHVYRVNLKGTFLCTQTVAKQMIKQGGGKIINISSLAGRRPKEFLGAYMATKFGVIGLTQITALELGRYGVTCNAIAPGFIDTPLWRGRDEREAEILGIQPTSSLEKAVKNIPLGRAGQPEDVANVVSFLASSDSDYINGQTINVCGGSFFS